MAKKITYTRPNTGGIMLAGTGRGGCHENRKRPDKRLDSKRWNSNRDKGD
jgi:hypothetical protein